MLRFSVLIFSFLFAGLIAGAQKLPPGSHYGKNDTLNVAAIFYDGEWMPYQQLQNVYISKLSEEELAKYLQEYDRLRRAVYATYPYALRAGAVINDVNLHLKDVDSKRERKKYLKSREAELRKEFSDPISNLSVYQGKVMMKLIYRETGSDCYDLVKEYRGGLNARMYQTVYYFFGGSLKQDFDPKSDATDRKIETIVQELNNYWYGTSRSAASGR